MTTPARPFLRAVARRSMRSQPRLVAQQQALSFSSTRPQQKLPGGTPGETRDPSEQKTPLGPYYESMLIAPQPIPKAKPEAPPSSSPKSPSSSGKAADKPSDKPSDKASDKTSDKTDASKKVSSQSSSPSTDTTTTTTEAAGLRTDPDPVPPPQSIPLSSSSSFPSSAASVSSISANEPSSLPSSSSPNSSSSSSSPITFGTKLGGPANEAARAERLRALRLSQGTLIAGILVPPRPDEPDNCCMSGCVNCVWDRYRDEMEEWAAISVRAEAALQAQRAQGAPGELGKVSAVKGMPSLRSPGAEAAAATTSSSSSSVAVSMDDDGGGSDTNWTVPPPTAAADSSNTARIAKDLWDDELYKNVPIGIREFMKQEKRLKEKHRREGTKG